MPDARDDTVVQLTERLVRLNHLRWAIRQELVPRGASWSVEWLEWIAMSEHQSTESITALADPEEAPMHEMQKRRTIDVFATPPERLHTLRFLKPVPHVFLLNP